MLRTMTDRVMEEIGNFVKNPWTNMAMGAILFLTSLYEAWGSLAEDLSHMRLGTHHGIILFGLFTMLKSTPDLFESLERIHRGIHED